MGSILTAILLVDSSLTRHRHRWRHFSSGTQSKSRAPSTRKRRFLDRCS